MSGRLCMVVGCTTTIEERSSGVCINHKWTINCNKCRGPMHLLVSILIGECVTCRDDDERVMVKI